MFTSDTKGSAPLLRDELSAIFAAEDPMRFVPFFDWSTAHEVKNGIDDLAIFVAGNGAAGARAPYVYVDAASKEATHEITGRAQSMRCGFCRRTVAAWGALPRRGRTRFYEPDVAKKAQQEHVPRCGVAFLRERLCRWSIGCATFEERTRVDELLREYRPLQPNDSDSLFDRYTEDARRMLARILPTLPQPPDSEFVMHLEMLLVSLSRILDPVGAP